MKGDIFELWGGRESLAPGALEGFDDVGGDGIGPFCRPLQYIHGNVVVVAPWLAVDDPFGISRVSQPGLLVQPLGDCCQEFQKVIGQVTVRIDHAATLVQLHKLPEQTLQKFALPFAGFADDIYVGVEFVQRNCVLG